METVVADDGEAVERARLGDARSFGLLVERHQEAAFRAAWLIVRDAAAAEDLAQEAFMRAHRSLASFRTGAPFRPWLLRIVTNLALNEVRARSRREGLLRRTARLADRGVAPPDSDIEQRDEAAALLRAMDELAADDRVVLYLRYFRELPEREIATAIGKAPGTVKSRLHRAGGRLRAVIEGGYPELRERADA